MAKGTAIENHVRIALADRNYYARQGIKTLLGKIAPLAIVEASVDDYRLLDHVLGNSIDILFLSENIQQTSTSTFLECISRIRYLHPELLLCMYSAHTNSLLRVQSNIDAFISLQESVYHWRINFLKLINHRHQLKKDTTVQSLTPTEWRVLEELKKGLDISYIAKVEKLSYRRVSAIKHSAIRKLGLRNKTDLLIFLTS